MSRVASLQTPQRRASPSPSSSPARRPTAFPSDTDIPSSGPLAAGSPSSSAPAVGPSRLAETTYHRKLRSAVEQFGARCLTWDEVVKSEGLKAASGVINESTEMDNLLLLPEDVRPAIQPHLEALHAHRQALTAVTTKLAKILKSEMAAIISKAENLYFEAFEQPLHGFDLDAALWCTWTMLDFVDSMIAVMSLHVKHLDMLRALSDKILDSSTSFDDAKTALERWRDLAYAGDRRKGVLEWQDLLEVEMGQPSDSTNDKEGYLGSPVSGHQGAPKGSSKLSRSRA